MSFTEELKVLLVGNATSAVNAFRETGSASDALQAKGTTTGNMLAKLGIQGAETGALLSTAVAGGATVAGAAIAKFAFDGIDHFASLTGEVRGYQRVLGGSAEDSSRLAAAVRTMGMDATVAQTGFFQLGKRIGEGTDTLAKWGVEIARNRDGSVDMAKTVENVAQKYGSLADQGQRDAFVFENFGRAGQALVPLLSKSKEELQAFYDAAGAHGEIFSADDLQKGREYTVAMHELDAAWEGLSARAGSELIPVVTRFARGLDETIKLAEEAGPVLGAAWDVATAPLRPFADALHSAADELGLVDHAAKAIGPDLGDLAARFAGLNATQAVAAFKALNTEFDKQRGIPKVNAELENFIQIAEQSPAAAQAVITGLQAQGVNTDLYARALANIVQKKKDDIAASDANSDANKLLTGTYEDQIKVLDERNNALLAGYDKTFAAMHADESARDALDKLNTSYHDAIQSGKSQAEASEAQSRALTGTEEAFVRAAAAAGANAEKDHEAEGATAAHAAGIQAQKVELGKLMETLAPDASLRVFLQGYIDKLDDPAVNTTHTATVIADTSPAHAALDGLEARLNKLFSDPRQITIGVAAALTGGAGNLQSG